MSKPTPTAVVLPGRTPIQSPFVDAAGQPLAIGQANHTESGMCTECSGYFTQRKRPENPSIVGILCAEAAGRPVTWLCHKCLDAKAEEDAE